MSATYMWRLDNDKENEGTPQNDCNKFIEELRLWMSDQDIRSVHGTRRDWNGPKHKVLNEVRYRLQPSVKQVPLPEEHEKDLAKHIKAIRALMVKLDDEERKQLQSDFVLSWNPKGTKYEVLVEAMRRLGGPVPVPSHNGLKRTPVKVQAVAEKQVGERLDKGPVAPLRASKGKKRNVDDSDKIATKKSRGKKRSLDDSEDTTSNSIEKRQGKKRRSENDDNTASKKRRTGTMGDYGVPETMPEFIEGSSSGRNKDAGNYGLFLATPESNEYREAPFTVKPSSSSRPHHEDGPYPANRNLESSARRGIVPVGEGSGTTPGGVRTDEFRAPPLYAVGSGLPPTPSGKQNSGQAPYNSSTLPPGSSAPEHQQAEQLDPQRQEGYAHESKLQYHMSYPSSQTGDAGIDQEISAVLPHGQERTSHDVVGLEDEEEENHTETETTYDWSREQDMFVQFMIDPASEMEERWTALMQDDTMAEWWDGMCVLEQSWGETWGEMMESEDGTRSWNAI